jgi:hypothetical protein
MRSSLVWNTCCRIWQAQMTTTRKPCHRREYAFLRSRRTFSFNLTLQNRLLVRGSRPFRHEWWRCQKQPWTMTAIRC